MKIEQFTTDQENRVFAMTRLVLSNDRRIDSSTFRFAVLFHTWWFLDNEPKGLTYSTREFSKKFGFSQMQCQRFLKRLETFGYIRIEDFKDRRKLYIPTEKLVGYRNTETGIEREDVRNITSSDPGQKPGGTNPDIGRELSSDEYTLYLIPPFKETCAPDYAEPLPNWPQIEKDLLKHLEKTIVSKDYIVFFKNRYEKKRIPLEHIKNIINSFAIEKRRIKNKLGWLTECYKNAIKAFEIEISEKREEMKIAKKKEKERYDKNVASSLEEIKRLAYKLNSGEKIDASDYPENLMKRLETNSKVSIDADGFVKRLPNVLFYQRNGENILRTATLYDIDALKRQGNNIIPGIEVLLEKVI